jgi:hypothetical protein
MRRRAILGAAGTLLIAAALILAARGWDASEKGGSRAPAASDEVAGRVPPVSLAGVDGERIALPASRPGALFSRRAAASPASPPRRRWAS